jgi:hypothetical protein
MHCQDTACTRSFNMGLTSALAKSWSVLNANKIIFYKFYENLVNTLYSKVVLLFQLTKALSMRIYDVYDIGQCCNVCFEEIS